MSACRAQPREERPSEIHQGEVVLVLSPYTPYNAAMPRSIRTGEPPHLNPVSHTPAP